MKLHRKLCTASFKYHQRIVSYLKMKKMKDDLNVIEVLIEHIDNAKEEMLRQIVEMA